MYFCDLTEGSVSIMKKMILAVFILSLMVIFLPEYSNGKDLEVPGIKIFPEMVDFGKVIQGEEKELTFRIKNTGKAILEIKRLTPGCDCMEASIEKNKILAGETVNIKVILDTWDYLGDIEKDIIVFSNDPKESFRKVIVRGNVEAAPLEIEINVKPSRWILGDIAPKGMLEREVLVRNTGDKPIRIHKAAGSSRKVKASVSTKYIGVNQTSMVNMKIKPGRRKGTVKQSLYLTLEIPYEVYAQE